MAPLDMGHVDDWAWTMIRSNPCEGDVGKRQELAIGKNDPFKGEADMSNNTTLIHGTISLTSEEKRDRHRDSKST